MLLLLEADFVAIAIPAIGNGCPKLVTASARELKEAVSRVAEVEWAKYTLFFFLRDRVIFLNVHIDSHFKRENAAVF